MCHLEMGYIWHLFHLVPVCKCIQSQHLTCQGSSNQLRTYDAPDLYELMVFEFSEM